LKAVQWWEKEMSEAQPKGTAEVAIAAHQDFGLDKIIKSAELIHAVPEPHPGGKALTLFTRKCFNLMLGVAGSHGFQDRTYGITKKELRRSHKSNERISDVVDALTSIKMRVEVRSPAGKLAEMTINLLSSTIRELDPTDDSVVYFRFTPEFSEIHKQSKLWAALAGRTMLQLSSTYALILYEVGCQMVGRADPTMRITVEDLRNLLHIGPDSYTDWANLRRRTLDRAVEEVNQLAHFNVVVPENQIRRVGRKVTSIELQFFTKSDQAAAAATKERSRHRVGRRARRNGTVETIAPVTAEDFALIWRKACGLMVNRERGKVRPWLDKLRLLSIENGRAKFTAETELACEWATTRIDNVIREALAKVSGSRIDSLDVIPEKSSTIKDALP
jgi:hypothetical protein